MRVIRYKVLYKYPFWWYGDERNLKRYLCMGKGGNYRVKALSQLRGIEKHHFTPEEIRRLRIAHPEFDLLFELKETYVYIND